LGESNRPGDERVGESETKTCSAVLIRLLLDGVTDVVSARCVLFSWCSFCKTLCASMKQRQSGNFYFYLSMYTS